MAYVTIIAMLALVQFQYFGIAVGRARGRHGVEAPAVTGDETFERFHRAHQNTMEQLIVFLPALFACASFANEILAVACGVGFLVGRAWYFRSYVADPDSRGKGMILTMASSVILLVGGLIGALRTVLSV
jgi:glutathione S-transferase